MGTPDPSTDTKAETMRIASKVGIVLATVGMTIGLLGGPAKVALPSTPDGHHLTDVPRRPASTALPGHIIPGRPSHSSS